MASEETKPAKCKFCVVTFIAFALWLLGSLGFFLRVLKKVLTGHGLDYYTTFWGVQFNYVGALTVFIAGAILIAISPIIYWFSTMEERSFKKKYGIRDKQT